MPSWIGFGLVGISAGILAGIFGIGGGLIVVPALVIAFGYSQHAASGTSLVALLLPVGILGAAEYYRAGKIGPEHIRAGLLIAMGMFVGTLLGSKVALMLSGPVVRKLFAGFLGVIAVRLWFWGR
jgi:uncharacterized protein